MTSCFFEILARAEGGSRAFLYGGFAEYRNARRPTCGEAPQGPSQKGAEGGSRKRSAAPHHEVSSGYEACNLQTPAESPNDSISTGPAIGPELGAADTPQADPETLAPDAAGGGREGLIAELARRVAGLALAGDAKALAVATDALQRLVEAPGGSKAPVVDLASRRSPRGSR